MMGLKCFIIELTYFGGMSQILSNVDQWWEGLNTLQKWQKQCLLSLIATLKKSAFSALFIKIRQTVGRVYRWTGTLSNILTMKLQYPESTTPCFKWQPTEELMKSSRSATSGYNKAHSSKETS